MTLPDDFLNDMNITTDAYPFSVSLTVKAAILIVSKRSIALKSCYADCSKVSFELFKKSHIPSFLLNAHIRPVINHKKIFMSQPACFVRQLRRS